jgi:ABC-2 type transport system ATP-binding protein
MSAPAPASAPATTAPTMTSPSLVPPLVADARVELRHASRWYGNVVAVNDVSCSLGPGITGVLGPNGAGKTTVLHMMAGLLTPSAGEVLVDGKPSSGNPQVYHSLALVPEREAVHPFLTGREFVTASAELYGLSDVKGAVDRAIELVGLADAQGRKVETYSKGMRQRIKIAGALVHDPGIVLLDEPFNGMDPRQRLHMMNVLRQVAAAGKVVVISSHILEELNDLANNVLVMVAGRLAASGHYREIRRLMTDRPHRFRIRSSDDRKLATALLTESSVFAVELTEEGIIARTSDRSRLTRSLPRLARDERIRLLEIHPTDESLESVFSYLVDR